MESGRTFSGSVLRTLAGRERIPKMPFPYALPNQSALTPTQLLYLHQSTAHLSLIGPPFSQSGDFSLVNIQSSEESAKLTYAFSSSKACTEDRVFNQENPLHTSGWGLYSKDVDKCRFHKSLFTLVTLAIVIFLPRTTCRV